MTLLSLSTGRLAVDLAPSAGGSIACFTVDGADVLRPMAPQDVASGKGNNASAFPHAVIYVLPGRPYFCVEPVSHANGKVDEALLARGATLAGEIAFHLSDL